MRGSYAPWNPTGLGWAGAPEGTASSRVTLSQIFWTRVFVPLRYHSTVELFTLSLLIGYAYESSVSAPSLVSQDLSIIPYPTSCLNCYLST